MNKDKLILFSGPASNELGNLIARYLNQPLGWIQVNQFSDGETSIEITENIRGKHIFLIQSTYQPGNEHLVQLLLMADACKRASAESISAVIPYFGYSRQDRRPRNTRGPVSAKLVANLIETAGIQRLITVDLHADQIEGFFSIPVDNIYSSQILLSDIWKKRYQDPVIVSPDVGGVLRARAIARRLDSAGLAIIDKRREAANKSEVMNIIGDVDRKTTILFDDMVDTAGTLTSVANVSGKIGPDGKIKDIDKAMLSDSASTVAGAMLGTSTVTTYVESAAGVKAGGKTGMTSLTIGVLFLACLFFSPLATSLPKEVDAAALIYIATLFVRNITDISWDDAAEAGPAVLAMIAMPFTYSISNGIALAFISYAAIKICTGKIDNTSPAIWVIAIASVVSFWVA